MMHSESEQYDVAVVGLGPVGMTTALLLDAHGLRVLGLEKRIELHPLPRALGMDHETARTLQGIGMMDALEPFTAPYRTSEYRAADGALLRRIVAAPEPFPLAWPPNMTFIQPEMERLLLERATTSPNLTIRSGAEVEEVSVTTSGAVLRIADIVRGGASEASVRYVVACDGASSPVRQTLGLTLEDLAFDEPWLVVDVLLTEDVALPEVNLQICDPDRPMTYVRGPDRLRRWEIMMRPGEQSADVLQDAAIWQFLNPFLLPSQGEIWRASTYRFHALVAETWRSGPVFLAGDAAHQTPPFLAQGLNQGIRDASNLAWKLAAVIADGADDALLDSYERERRPNVHAVISITKELGRIICEQDPTLAAERNQRMLADVAQGRGQFVRQDFVPPLTDGLLDERRSPGTGKTFPQPWIKTPEGVRRMDDHVGAGLRALLGKQFVAETAIAALASSCNATLVRVQDETTDIQSSNEIAIVEQDRVLADWMSEHRCDAALVRPDNVVFGTASGAAELIRLLQDFRVAIEPGKNRRAGTQIDTTFAIV